MIENHGFLYRHGKCVNYAAAEENIPKVLSECPSAFTFMLIKLVLHDVSISDSDGVPDKYLAWWRIFG